MMIALETLHSLAEGGTRSDSEDPHLVFQQI